MNRQPLLHDLLVCLSAPSQAWSGADGQIRAVGAHGVYAGDVRVLSTALLTVAGEEPEPVMAAPDGPGAVVIVSLARNVDDPPPDPTVRIERRRRAAAGVVSEEIVVSAATAAPVRVPLRLELSCDLAPMSAVKAGRAPPALPAEPAHEAALRWTGDGVVVLVSGDAASRDVSDLVNPALRWDVTVAAGQPQTLRWRVEARDDRAVVAPAGEPLPEWSAPRVRADDWRLAALVGQALDDLAGLRVALPDRPADTFLAGGAPWYLTLFGRDSLWAARMLLPLGTDLAGRTLRALADRQGRRTVTDTAEEPGKILHELRRRSRAASAGDLPPIYYGTVDATPLWLCLLHDAWRWGLPAAEVASLLPHAQAALAWMADFGDADGDGFLEYVDVSGRGLVNQGWKDSGDSVQWRDGRLATGPIALAEVQGYAYEAAVGGAALLDAFGLPDAGRWRSWAAELAERFRREFWVDDGDGPYPAIALDADKRRVDTLTSNIGHLLGTGLLDGDESAAVAHRLASAEMDSGFGLRTMATSSSGYWPLRYHGGSVWPHDTAIVVGGLARSGHIVAAAGLVEGLLAAGQAFDYRLPELYSGDTRTDTPRPVPYPAACRPQAWSAAAAVALLSAVLGITPDVPAGTLAIRPMAPSPVGALTVDGLRVAGQRLSLSVDAEGRVLDVTAPAYLRHDRGKSSMPW
ncbi:MAG: glycogen debranching N-terminal domain-containing protein [Jiangellaceae bacterium]